MGKAQKMDSKPCHYVENTTYCGPPSMVIDDTNRFLLVVHPTVSVGFTSAVRVSCANDNFPDHKSYRIRGKHQCLPDHGPSA